jgi:hypothetical protein
MTKPEFHRLEEYNFSKSRPSVLLTFKTERFGYLQTRLRKTQNKYHGDVISTWKFETLDQEPDLNMFTDKDINHMEKTARIIWRMVHDAPAAKHRFE